MTKRIDKAYGLCPSFVPLWHYTAIPVSPMGNVQDACLPHEPMLLFSIDRRLYGILIPFRYNSLWHNHGATALRIRDRNSLPFSHLNWQSASSSLRIQHMRQWTHERHYLEPITSTSIATKLRIDFGHLMWIFFLSISDEASHLQKHDPSLVGPRQQLLST